MTSTTSPPSDLDRIDARLDRIEARLDRIASVLDRATPAIAMAVDAADDWIREVQGHGVDVDARAAAVARFVEGITAPEVLDRVGAVADRLESLEPAIAWASQLEGGVAMGIDAFDGWARDRVSAGVDLDARARGAMQLIEALTEPVVADALMRIVQGLPHLEPLIRLAEAFEPTTAMVFDALDEQIRTWQSRGIDIEERIRSLGSVIEGLTAPALQQPLKAILDAAATPSPDPLGALGLLRSLSDPEVQRAAGLAVTLARSVGGQLPATPRPR